MAGKHYPPVVSPEDNPLYHDTYKLLRCYRDSTYSLKVAVRQVEIQFQLEYKTSIDEFLDSIYTAGADLTGSQIEEWAKSISRSNKMIKLLLSSVDLLRKNHKHGEQYYWILYYAFLSPQELKNTDEILEALEEHIANISYRTYYRKRQAAINALSSILFHYLPNNIYGEYLLRLLVRPQMLQQLDRLLLSDYFSHQEELPIEHDGIDSQNHPVLLAYDFDMQRINRFNTGLNVYDLSGILVCFDFQIPCLRKYLTADIQFSSIDFQKFKRGFFHEKP